MLARQILLALGVMAGCAARTTDANQAAQTSEDVEAAPLRLMTGDGTSIGNDWTASEGGRTFAVVQDGYPTKPWISAAHESGTKSIAFQVPTDESGHKERVEYKVAQASDVDGLHFDNARYAGFAFKLGENPAPFEGSSIFWQAWQGYPFGPPVSLKIERGPGPDYPIRLAVRNASVGPYSTTPDITVWRGAIEANVWHTFLLYVEPRYDRAGALRLWMDGTQVLRWAGEIGYDPRATPGTYAGLDVKNGIYQPSANQGHTFYFDQIVFASSYAAASSTLDAIASSGRR